MPRFDQRLGFTRAEADEYYRRALEAYKKGQFDVAIDALTEAIELWPGRSEYYAARGLIYFQDGVDDKAAADFDTALKHFPYEMLGHYGKGMLAYKARNWEEAIRHFTQAHYIDPQRPETLYYLALAYFHAGDRTHAANYMALAHQIFEASGHRYKTYSGRWIKELEKSLARKPESGSPSLPQQQTLPLLGEENT
jgi:tetratricopeptide (TPR) repeat protein